MEKRLVKIFFVILFLALAFFVGLGFVSAGSVTATDTSSTLIEATISDASDLYAYEVNFSVDSGSSPSVTSANFLGSGADATYGSNTRGDFFFVYGSKLDSSQTGTTGNGALFNITHSGSLTLKGLTEIDSDGNEVYTSYNVVTADGTTTTTTSSGGSGSGGSATSASEASITLDQESLNFNVVFGGGDTKELRITNNGNKSIVLSVDVEGEEGLKDVVNVPSRIVLGARKSQIIKVNMDGVELGLLTGKILFKIGSSVIDEVNVVTNVRSENFLFDPSISLAEVSRVISPGDILRAQVNLLQVGPKEDVNLKLTYVIKDFSGVSYLEEGEEISVSGGKDYVKEFFTEELGLSPGKHIIGMEIVYPGAFATSSTQFVVEGGVLGLGEGGTVLAIVVIVVVIIVLFIVFWTLKKSRKARGKVWRKRR